MTQEFQIDIDIYTSENIQEAIQDFSEVTKISLDGKTLKIDGETEQETQEIFLEFMNYVLSL